MINDLASLEKFKLALPKSPRMLCVADPKLRGHSREAALHYVWDESMQPKCHRWQSRQWP